MTDLLLGVAVLIWRGAHFLMLKRRGAHGAGSWSIPGGHIDPEEWPNEAAAREMREETGIEPLRQLHPVSFDWSDFPDVERRYVTLIFTTSVPRDTEFRLCEPSKAEMMQWVSPDFVVLPTPLFEPLRMLLYQEPGVLWRAREMVLKNA